MINPSPVNAYAIAVGNSPTIVPFVTTSAPSSTNIKGPNGAFLVGQMWINSSANTVYVLTSFSSSGGVISATWTQL